MPLLFLNHAFFLNLIEYSYIFELFSGKYFIENPSIKNHFQDSAKTGYNGVVSETAAASSMNGSISDCVNLEFDNQVFSFRGTFCKSGQLNVEVSALGMKIDRIDVDVSKV